MGQSEPIGEENKMAFYLPNLPLYPTPKLPGIAIW